MLVILCAFACVSVGGVAHAHDSLAPPGAWHNWLPDEGWVHHRWVPFDEAALTHALGLPRLDLQSYLYNDHHSLAQLAQRRGLSSADLATRLVVPWQGISDAHRAVLRDRTMRILTQGHLSQHVFFHVFHGRELFPHSQDLFGMPAPAYEQLRHQGLSYVAIARHGGVPAAAMRAGVVALVEREHAIGIAQQESWPSQSHRLLERTLAWLPCWLRRPLPARDPANPYGKNRLLHGVHDARWPANARQRRDDERRVSRVLRRLPASCWTRPRAWSWATAPAGAAAPPTP